MKKLLVLLLISILALFVFASCTVPPSEGEGEGEVEKPIDIEIVDAIEIGGKSFVNGDDQYTIRVTFQNPADADNVIAEVSECSGDYSTKYIPSPSINTHPVVLWPNEDKTVWEGTFEFDCCISEDCDTCYAGEGSGCCATIIWVEYGNCVDCHASTSVIVDCEDPWAGLELCMDGCDCEGCELSFATGSCSYACASDEELCGDSHDAECPDCDHVYDCSGLASWSLAIYEDDPYEECCEVPCDEPIWTASGTDCPITAVTDCLTEFAGVQTGYTTVCETTIETSEVCTSWVQCYCVCEEGDPGAVWDESDQEYQCPCECEVPVCCEYGIETEEVIVCTDTPVYDCNWLFVVLTMVDNVGNEAQYGAWIASSNYDACNNVCIEEITGHPCLDDACGVFVNAPSDCDCPNVPCTCVVPNGD